MLTKVLIPVREGPECNNITWKTEFEADRQETALLEHCHSQYRRASETQFGLVNLPDALIMCAAMDASMVVVATTSGHDNCVAK